MGYNPGNALVGGLTSRYSPIVWRLWNQLARGIPPPTPQGNPGRQPTGPSNIEAPIPPVPQPTPEEIIRHAENPPTINPWRQSNGQPLYGFENFGTQLQNTPRGDALSIWPRKVYRPGVNGNPTYERVQQISNAMLNQAGGRNFFAPSSGMGRGADIGDSYGSQLLQQLVRRRQLGQ